MKMLLCCMTEKPQDSVYGVFFHAHPRITANTSLSVSSQSWQGEEAIKLLVLPRVHLSALDILEATILAWESFLCFHSVIGEPACWGFMSKNTSYDDCCFNCSCHRSFLFFLVGDWGGGWPFSWTERCSWFGIWVPLSPEVLQAQPVWWCTHQGVYWQAGISGN